jgi:cellulose synthase/poly-beta-1,6-N-acetylglucosamine synthase-like glycosyltransferase
MSGIFHYFLSGIDPSEILGFSSALPGLMWSAVFSWWLIFVIPLAVGFLPGVVCWIVYLVRPAVIRPTLSLAAGQTEPFVSVVIAGRNESASIGQAIRAALQCGYANLEVIFVDDHSDDDSLAVARRAARSVMRTGSDTHRVRIYHHPVATARRAHSISVFGWREANLSRSSTPIRRFNTGRCSTG